MTDNLYIPHLLLEGVVTMLEEALPPAVNVGVGEYHPVPPFVNLWPSAPDMKNWTMGGPTAADLTFQATSAGESVVQAWKVGSLVRQALGRDTRGRFNNPIEVPGFHVIDIRGEQGHADNSGGVATWTENFTVLFHSTIPATP